MVTNGDRARQDGAVQETIGRKEAFHLVCIVAKLHQAADFRLYTY
jgi:hypothetical protein